MILGLDLGSNSIGWALIDEAHRRVIHAGVRVFPEGVDRDKQGGELSKNETRRVKRGQRRQIARRARRKRILRRALIEAGLYPADPDEQQRIEELDPYQLRRRALDERLGTFEIGRVLLHLNQRRGFLSNRRTDRERKKETSDMLDQISDLAEEIAREKHQTLGEHLAARLPARGEPARTPQDLDERVRRRHTRRDMYLGEFETIWEKQREYHPQLLTEKLKYGTKGKQSFPTEPEGRRHRQGQTPLERYGIHGIIFFQRSMYWPKDAVGFCELEPRQRRCPRADRLAQKARLYQEVNNLRLIDSNDVERCLSERERTSLIEYLSSAKERTFDQIKKHLRLLEGDRFNLETLVKGDTRVGGRTKLKGMVTDAILAHRDRFAKEWYDLPEDRRDEIVRDLLAFDRGSIAEEVIYNKAHNEWGLTKARAEKVLDVQLPGGYVKFSRTALENLLPHLRAGLPLMRNEVDAQGRLSTDDAIHKAGYLRPDERGIKPLGELPGPNHSEFPDLPNPIVQQAIYEIRRVVNAIIREYRIPDEIRVEMARDIKGSIEKRREMRLRQIEQEKARDEAANRIREQGHAVNRESINRYLLWQEQGKTCIYTGRPIPISKLFGGEIEIEHILPYPRSLDNSMANKAVCYRYANQEKGNQTPYEWLGETQPERYAEVLQRARKLGHYGKYKKFTLKHVELREFIARQLVDTAYISRAVLQYLKLLGIPIHGRKGQTTESLRRCWGLNTVLRQDQLNLKNREDHRRHAVDAVVIALTDQNRLRELARGFVDREHFDPETGEVEIQTKYTGIHIDVPWQGFHSHVEDVVNAINVSHRPRRGVSGTLHEETIYGETERPNVYVSRQPLESLTASMVPHIRDDVVRSKIESRLAEFGITPGRGKGNVPKKVWKEPLWMNEQKGVQIKRVRLFKPEQTVQPIRKGTTHEAFVKPGENHHACIFEWTANGKTGRDAEYCTLLEASRRVKNREPIVRRTHQSRRHARFLMSLCTGDMVLINVDGQVRLMVVSTLVSTQKRIHLVDANDARRSADRKDVGLTPNSLIGKYNARKVTVDPLGRLRWAERKYWDDQAHDRNLAEARPSLGAV